MSEAQSSFPRRDSSGRITGLADLGGVVLAGLVIGVLALVAFDWAFESIGLADFGKTNGWLAVILPAWLFVEEYRAWGPGPARAAAAVVGAGVGLTTGLLAAGLAAAAAPLVSGAAAAGAFALVYTLIWYFGVRWLDRRTG
ncbi:hypothetical protein OG792_00960 [Micromonospora sp. NBC_01699]|uniref:hypothetical protein n=1 Tax=Micromonospora sp. NBC_01699 TaxID=2975984 RepID=UPI002E2840E1|nr:hypothetical protein [Micromonospora sp. NBC_01699]